jgi:hypothetical protein
VLFGRRPSVLVLTALYALNPLVVANLTWLTTAACLVPAELAAIVAIHLHVRYTVTGQLRSAAGAGVALLAGMCFWEKTAIVGLILPILSLGYLSTGTPRQRLGALAGRWRGWLLTAVPPLLFVAYFVANHYGGAARSISAGDLVDALKTAWLRMVAPSLFGGPWTWFDTPSAFVSWSSPTDTVVVLSQLGSAGLVVLGWRRTGARSLWAWSIPAVSVVVGTAMIAIGRYAAFGDLISVTMRYSFDFALVLVLGVALALVPSSAEAIAARVNRPPAPSSVTPAAAPRPRRRVVALAAACAAFVVLASVVSSLRFQHRWEQNPTEPYVSALERNIKAAGPGVNLYDTPVSSTVVPYFFGPGLHLSDLLGWTDLDVRYNSTASPARLVGQDGSLQQASLIPAATAVLPKNQICEVLAHGVGRWRVPLRPSLPPGEGFLHMEYFQQRPSTMGVFIETAEGKLVAPTVGSRTSFPVTLGAQLMRLPSSSSTAVVFTSDSKATNICIGNIVVGAPFAPSK